MLRKTQATRVIPLLLAAVSAVWGTRIVSVYIPSKLPRLMRNMMEIVYICSSIHSPIWKML